MAYASVIHVQSLNPGRQITANSKPSATQVALYIDQTAAELDSILRVHGYTVPVATTATVSWTLLEGYNALGAYALMERSAQSSERVDSAVAMWESAKKMLEDGTVELPDADQDTTVSLPRSSLGQSGAYATPFFTRDQQF